MKLVLISDTHGQHDKVNLPEGDVLIHAGDFTKYGRKGDVENFAQWLNSLDFKYIIVIAGNHDFFAQDDAEYVKQILMIDARAIYLQDEAITLDGVKFYGSPWTPKFFNWAFMKDRGFPLKAMWNKIPDDTNVLITHGPPRGILDIAISEPHAGCDDLLKRVQELPLLKLHVFGHLHEGYGKLGWLDPKHPVKFVNASQLDDYYQMTHSPIVVEL